jgi:hypothetical protein
MIDLSMYHSIYYMIDLSMYYSIICIMINLSMYYSMDHSIIFIVSDDIVLILY